ncbi:hypothetical protein glysoja_026649 [Glycine soja]|uniref:Uncharacterized protein n=1 Tax=Glycine soja TaxID=3848 RepID=A0A0B2PTC6_GLYSO|nr:hypothetical protein glysoja_026649 [Glycine soja]
MHHASCIHPFQWTPGQTLPPMFCRRYFNSHKKHVITKYLITNVKTRTNFRLSST